MGRFPWRRLLLVTPAAVAALSLSRFELDLSSGLLTLVFDAAVQSATINASCVHLQSNLTRATERYRLTGATEGVFATSNTSDTVNIALTDHDLKSLLFFDELAVDAASTWLTLSAGCVRAATDGVTSAAVLRPIAPDAYTADDMPPALEAYVLDMDAGLLALRFSEPVNQSSLDLSMVVLQTASNALDADVALALAGAGATVLAPTCHDMVYASTAPSSAAPSTMPTYLTVPPTAAPTETSAPAPTADVDATGTPTAVPMYAPTHNGTGAWTICENVTTVFDALWLNVSLGDANSNAIKSAYPLASQESLTFLALSGAVAADRAGNGVQTQFWTVSEGQAPHAWIGDTTPPELAAFAVDMDAGEVKLTFTETVDAAEFEVSCITLQETRENRTGGLAYALWGAPNRGTVVAGGDNAALLTLVLSRSDLDEVKRLPRLMTALATSHIALECDKGFRDTAWPPNYGVPQLRTAALAASTYVADETRPKLVSGSLDLDGPTLTLEFDETVNASSLDVDRLSVQSTERDRAITERIVLASPAAVDGPGRGSSRASGPGSNLSIAVGAHDFAAMKLATTFGATMSSTWLAALSGAVTDMAGNLLVEAPTSKAVQATNGVIRDARAPWLDAFALDLNMGVLTLSFDEPVTRASLRLDHLSLRVATHEDATIVALTGVGAEFASEGSIAARAGRALLGLGYTPVATVAGAEVLYVALGPNDRNAIKRHAWNGLAADRASTLLSAGADWVADSATANHALSCAPRTAANYSADRASPQLEHAILNLDAGTLVVVVDEPVVTVGANASVFRLTSHADGGGRAVDIGPATSVAPDAAGATLALVFRLDCETLDALKVRRQCQLFQVFPEVLPRRVCGW